MRKDLIIETTFATVSVTLIVTAFILRAVSLVPPVFPIVLFALAFIVGGFHKAVEGVKDTIKEKRLNVEFLMILAALGAFYTGNYSEGAILILIFSISGVLESFANAKSEKALKSLLNLAPETAVLYENSEEEEVPLSEVNEGDHLIVKVGQKVPVDSVIVQGDTSVDQAAITGEFVPAPKHEGDPLYAGAIILEASVIIRATKSAGDSVIQKIVAFVEKAQQDQPKTESKIKRFERYYVYLVLLLSALFMIVPPQFGWLTSDEAMYRGIIVLVVGSPCALVASVSPAVLSALSNASRKHVLIKGGSRLEGVSEIGAVIFDKTGTLTTGEPKVTHLESDGVEKEKLKRLLYTVEQQSNHPLARAITEAYRDFTPYEGIQTKEKPGFGMEAVVDEDTWRIGRFECHVPEALHAKLTKSLEKGQTCVNIIKNDVLVGYVCLKDTIRASVQKTISAIQERGIHTIMMTGDSKRTAQALADTIGIDTLYSDCFPEDKVDIVKGARRRYGKVLMVGDGINDAPALSEADVAIAMGTGTDVSLETSDIVFIDDNLFSLTKVFVISSRLRGIIRFNVALSVLVIALLMIGNFVGRINLPFGVLVHEISTVMVVLNSLRLLK